MSEKSESCFSCRLIGGGGLFTAGCYVIHQSKKVKTISRPIIKAIGYGLGVMGILRFFELPPFKHRPLKEEAKLQEDIENDYVIAKFPSKFQ